MTDIRGHPYYDAVRETNRDAIRRSDQAWRLRNLPNAYIQTAKDWLALAESRPEAGRSGLRHPPISQREIVALRAVLFAVEA